MRHEFGSSIKTTLFDNHTFSAEEEVNGENARIKFRNCKTLPRVVTASGLVEIINCAAPILPSVRCPNLYIIDSAATHAHPNSLINRSLTILNCPNLTSLDVISCVESMRVENCWKFSGPINTNYLRATKVGRLQPIISVVDSICLKDCGFSAPDVKLYAQNEVSLSGCRGRSLVVESCKEFSFSSKKAFRDLDIQSKDIVVVASKGVRNLTLRGATRNIEIECPNIVNFSCNSYYRHILVRNCVVELPQPEHRAVFIVENLHPNQKFIKKLGKSSNEQNMFAIEQKNGDRYIQLNQYGDWIGAKESEQQNPHLPSNVLYKGNLRRKYVLFLQQSPNFA